MSPGSNGSDAHQRATAAGNGASDGVPRGHGGEEVTRRSQVRRALVAGTVGTSIEWYDFFLYGTAAALVFPELFFPDGERLRRAAGLVRDLRRRVRGAAGRRGDLRPLGRPHRPQGDARSRRCC